MFTVGKYRFNFQHENTPVEVLGQPFSGYTDCYVFEGEDEVPVIVGRGYCSSKDNFNRSVGRKVALTKALQSFDKTYRAEVWNKYFSIIKH